MIPWRRGFDAERGHGRQIANDRRKPLARYGAVKSALRERLSPSLYTARRDTTGAFQAVRLTLAGQPLITATATPGT